MNTTNINVLLADLLLQVEKSVNLTTDEQRNFRNLINNLKDEVSSLELNQKNDKNRDSYAKIIGVAIKIAYEVYNNM